MTPNELLRIMDAFVLVVLLQVIVNALMNSPEHHLLLLGKLHNSSLYW